MKTDAELRELALHHANGCIDRWVYEDMGELSEEFDCAFEEWKRVCDMAASAVVTIPGGAA